MRWISALRRCGAAAAIGLLLCGCRGQARVPAPDAVSIPEQLQSEPFPDVPARADELRGVWIPYLDLDALLTGLDPTAAGKALDGMMELCAARGINTVYWHVRAHSDAYYRSDLFPVAAAVAPLLEQDFDPLEQAVEAAHRHGLQLHAWINPYRVGRDPAAAQLEEDAVFCKGDVWYYNPGDERVRRLILDGVREILAGYEVDGIHFDDYFYPGDMAAAGESFENIPAGADVAAWRRTQVDALVAGVYGLVHSRGKVFGISPMANLKKCTDSAFADVALWMRQPGYVDYICPQIYFGFEHTTHPYIQELVRWVSLPRHDGVKLYVGLALYKAGLAQDSFAGAGAGEWSSRQDILSRQVKALRADGRADGFVIYRYSDMAHPGAAATAEWETLAPLMQP